MTLPEFDLVQTQWLKKYDLESRERWEMTRWQTFLLMKVHDTKNRLKSPQDLVLFSWEKREQSKNAEILKNTELFNKIFPSKLNEPVRKSKRQVRG